MNRLRSLPAYQKKPLKSVARISCWEGRADVAMAAQEQGGVRYVYNTGKM